MGLDLSYRHLRIRVVAESADTLAWLAEFLGPWFEVVEAPGSPDARIEVDATEGALDRWLAASTDTGETVDCFTLDAGRDLWSLRRGPTGEAGAYGADADVVLIPGRDGDLRVLTRGAERPRVRLTLVRALRELAIVHGAAEGAYGLHASAVAWEGRVLLFLGAKRSGKSSLMLHALEAGEAALVSNDRVEIRREGGRVIARGMPTVLTLRPGSVARHPRLEAALASQAWFWAITVGQARENARRGVQVRRSGRRPVPPVSAAQLADLLGAGLRAEGPLEGIVYSSVDESLDEAPGYVLRALPDAEARTWIRERGLLGGGRIAGFLSGAPVPSGEAVGDAVRRLVEGIPAYDLRMGERAYDGDALLAQLSRLGP